MIAADSSTLIAYIQGDAGEDVEFLHAALGVGVVTIPPVVLAEMLSEPRLPKRHGALVRSLPLLDLLEGFWLRVALIARKRRARLADAMIAQCCIDHDAALITRDRDFRWFADHCGLTLA